jgi:AAA family ATP:ADP antiporter
MMCGSLLASAPYVAAILLAVIVFWISATRSLGRQFNELTGEKPKEPEEVTAELKEAITGT